MARRSIAELFTFVVALAVAGAAEPLTSTPARAAWCGGLNQKPCPRRTGRPKCQRGLVHNFFKHRCVRRHHRGKANFMNSLAKASRNVAKLSGVCKKLLGALPAIRLGHGFVNTAVACKRGYSIGYRCAAPKVFNLIGRNARLAGRLETAFRTPACRRAPGPLKVFCAIGKVVDDFAVRPALCMAKVIGQGGFTRLANGDAKTIEYMCTAAGETAFKIAVNRAIGRRSRGRDNLARFLRKVRRIKRLGRRGARIDRYFQRLEREPACRGVLN
jgi:hypothetical protein